MVDDDDEEVEEVEDAEELWEVEAIVGQRVRHGATQYRVVWKGFAEAEATWETEASTQDWSATDLAALHAWVTAAQKPAGKKKEKDPNEVKKNLSAYNHFCATTPS